MNHIWDENACSMLCAYWNKRYLVQFFKFQFVDPSDEGHKSLLLLDWWNDKLIRLDYFEAKILLVAAKTT